MPLQDDDNLLVGRGTDNYKITYGGLKIKLTEDGIGGGGGKEAIVVAPASIQASETYAPSTLTATPPQVINGTKVIDYPAWYKDDVEIEGATGMSIDVTLGGVYKYAERWVGEDGNSVYPEATVTIEAPVIATPTVITPPDGAGVGGDTEYYPHTSAATVSSESFGLASVFWAKNVAGDAHCIYSVEHNGFVYSVGSTKTTETTTRNLFIIKHNATTGEIVQQKTFFINNSGFGPKGAQLVGSYLYVVGTTTACELFKFSLDNLSFVTSVILCPNFTSFTPRNIKAARNGTDLLVCGESIPSGQTKYHATWLHLDQNLNLIAGSATQTTNEYSDELNSIVETENYFVGVGQARSTGNNQMTLATFRWNKDGTWKGGQTQYSESNDYGRYHDIVTNGTEVWAIGTHRANRSYDVVIMALLVPDSNMLKDRFYITDGNPWSSAGVAVDAEGNGYFKRVQNNGNNSTLTKIDKDYNLVWHYNWNRADANEKASGFDNRANYSNGKIYINAELDDNNDPGWKYTWYALPSDDPGVLPDDLGPLRTIAASTPTLNNSVITGYGIGSPYNTTTPSVGASSSTISDGAASLMSDINTASETGSNTLLTLADNKVYDENSAEVSNTLDIAFPAGSTVTGTGGTPVADTAAYGTAVYIGNSGTIQVPTGIDNTVKSMIWVKCRSGRGAQSHAIFDTERGVQKYVSSDNNYTQGTGSDITSFDADGFTTVANSGLTNGSSGNYVAWNFRAAPGFFDVVTYKGDGIAGRTVPHSLGSEPGAVLVKKTSSSQNWYLQHKSLGGNTYLQLNNTEQKASNGLVFNNTLATSTEFFLGEQTATNGDGDEFVAYIFGDTPGKIKCGDYTGGGTSSRDVDCGFDVAWLLIKQEGSSSWTIWDSERGLSGSTNPYLVAENTYEEMTPSTGGIKAISNGFNASGSVSEGDWNATGNKYVYIAIAKNVTAGQMPPTGIVTEADPDSPSLTLSNVVGTWSDGMKAVGNTKFTSAAPDAETLQFVASVPTTTDGSITTWGDAVWTVTDKDNGGTQTGTKQILAGNTQKFDVGGDIVLQKGTNYDVTVKYSAPGSVAKTSSANNFTTGGSVDGWFNGTNSTENCHSIAYGAGRFVAIKDSSMMHSTDGITWSTSNINGFPSDRQWNDITFSDGKFVCVSRKSQNLGTTVYKVLYSSDGLSWSEARGAQDGTSGKLNEWTIVESNDAGNFVAFSPTNGSIRGMYANSSNLNSWSYASNPPGNVTVCAYGFNNFIAVSSSGEFFKSSDGGNSWSSAGNSPGQQIAKAMAAGKDDTGTDCMIVIESGNGNVWKTTDGTNWNRTAQSTGNVTKILWANDVWVGIGDGEAWHSIDGTTWTQGTPASGNVWSDLAYGSDKFVAVATSGDSTNSSMYSFTGKSEAGYFYFDTNTKTLTTGHQIQAKHGIDPKSAEAKALGYAELTEQPNYPVQAYLECDDGCYRPIRDYSPEMEQLAEARSRLASLEADEVNDDATDTALLTLLGNLNTRITALEDNN